MNYVLTENAVGKIRRAITPSAGNTGAVGANGRPIDPDMFPAPWTVRWSASANNGAGAWVIWLPDRSKLAMFGGAFISTITGVTAATKLPSGWYTIDDAQAASTAAYLVITVTDSTSVATAEISTSAGQSVTGTTVYNILVASMASVAATGAKSVKQFVDSTITFGGSSGGGGGGLTGTVEFVADVDWYVNGSVHQLRKRLRVLDLATGNVTDKANTTYANGWEVAANTTPISSII